MVGLVICGHGPFAAALLESAELIVGKQEGVTTVALELAHNLDDMHSLIGIALAQIDQGDGVLILLDLYGGTPSNAAALHFREARIEAVAGVNLPMLLEVLLGRQEKNLAELTALAEEIGHQGVVNVRATLFGANARALD
jgi:PTS system mannose-specific IIA component